MRRYAELKMLERAGEISELELQPRFELCPATKHGRAIFYVADFRYRENGEVIVEDVKGHKTEVYKLKKKLLLAKYPMLNFREVRA